MKRHANPKPSKEGLAHLRRVAKEAFPKYDLEYCSHTDLGGHRAPRDHTLGFRMIDAQGKYRSNVVWIFPQSLKKWTAQGVRDAVSQTNGSQGGSRAG